MTISGSSEKRGYKPLEVQREVISGFTRYDQVVILNGNRLQISLLAEVFMQRADYFKKRLECNLNMLLLLGQRVFTSQNSY